MVSKLRLLAAFGALFTAVMVTWQSAPPATVGGSRVQLRSTAAPMDPPTTMKSPIVATTDPSPFDPCRGHPVRRGPAAGPGLHPAESRGGAALPLRRRQLPAGGRADHLAKYDQSLPADAVETTINGHRAAQWWNLKPTYHNSYFYFSCMVAFKTSYGLIQQSLFYSTIYSSPEVDCPATNLQRANELSPTTSSRPAVAGAAIT